MHDEKRSHSHSHSHSHDDDAHSHDHSHSLFGHSHTHNSADSVFTQEEGGLKNPAIRVTWIGLLINLGMAITKGIGGIVFNSQSLIADAVHALSDLVSDVLTLATVTVAANPPSDSFPNGFGKIETLGSLCVSGILLLVGIGLFWSGAITVLKELLGDSKTLELATKILGHGHSHSHGGAGHDHRYSHGHVNGTGHESHGHTNAVDLNAMWLALGSIAIKEWIYHVTMKIANQTGSMVLVANAWHHRVDSLTSIVAVFTIGISHFFGAKWLDSVGGLLVSLVIIQAGYSSGKQSALELADCAKYVDPPVLASHRDMIESVLTEQAVESHGRFGLEDFEVSNVLLMPSGPNYISEIQLKTHGDMSIAKAVTASRYVEKELLKSNKRLKRVIIHLIDRDTLKQIGKEKKA